MAPHPAAPGFVKDGAANEMKVFCFFFSKKKRLLSQSPSNLAGLSLVSSAERT